MTPRQTPIRFEPELEQTLQTLSASTGLSVNNLVSMAVASAYHVTQSKAYSAVQAMYSVSDLGRSQRELVLNKLAGKKEK